MLGREGKCNKKLLYTTCGLGCPGAWEGIAVMGSLGTLIRDGIGASIGIHALMQLVLAAACFQFPHSVHTLHLHP